MTLQTKSVHSPPASTDGLRILATRYRGHGMRSELYDVWMANLAPSEELLKAYLSGDITPSQFRTRYRAEILGSAEDDPRNPKIANRGQKFTLRLLRTLAERMPITIMCHCPEDDPNCHRHTLVRLIESA